MTIDISKILPLPPTGDVTLYNSNCVDLRGTPPVAVKKVNLQFSPSPPPAVPLPQIIPDSGPNVPNRPSQGDGVLVGYMGGGGDPDIADRCQMESRV